VLLFPEGTFTAAAGLRPFRLGTFKAAVDTGVPIVPMALSGTRAVLRAGQAIPRPGPVHLWIGEPIPPEGDGWRAVVSLRDRVAAEIAGHDPEPRLDLVAGGPDPELRP
jgi:1-acyl-sn-glycerol-3-phosphate acyltransferase